MHLRNCGMKKRDANEMEEMKEGRLRMSLRRCSVARCRGDTEMEDLGCLGSAAPTTMGIGGRKIGMPPYVFRWSSTRRESRRSSARAAELARARGQLHKDLPMSGIVSSPDVQAKRLVEAE